MSVFRIDSRDLEFTLFEHLQMQQCLEYPANEGLTKETMDLVLAEIIKMGREVLGPLDQGADRHGAHLVDGSVVVSPEFRNAYEAFREGGWFAPANSSRYGGMGLPVPMSIALADVFTGACSAFMNFSGLTAAGARLIEAFGSEALRELMVAKLCSGEWMGTMCLTEPQAGSSIGDITTSATPLSGTDQYSLRGNKIFITGGDSDLPSNIIHLVLARIEGDEPGTKGVSLFAVPKYHLGPNGECGELNDIKVTGIEHKMGLRGSPTCSLSFGEEAKCTGWLVGEASNGVLYMFQMMNEARLLTGAQASGLANGAYQAALHFAKERCQGPRLKKGARDPRAVPIVEHPDVRRNLLLSKSISEGIRAMLLQAAVYEEESRHHPDESVRRRSADLVEFLTPICKAYASDQGFKVTELAIQIHGGYGYISEYGVEQSMRDIKIASIYEGTNGIQAMDLLGRKMRLKDGAVFMTWLQEVSASLAEVHGELEAQKKAVSTAQESIGQVAFYLQGAAREQLELAFLNATPFLEMCGHVEVARLLVGGANVAQRKLDAILDDAGIGDKEAGEFIGGNKEARYYDGKIKAAKFFVSTQLPKVHSLASSITCGDRSALGIQF